MARTRRTPTSHAVPWDVVRRTVVEYEGERYRFEGDRTGGVVVGETGDRWEVGRYVEADEFSLLVKLTPGAQTYFEARADQGTAFTDCDLVAAVVIASLGGHPDADEARAQTALSAVWSHHLAVVGGDEPRRIATTYAPTETKRIALDVQNMAVSDVRVTGCE